MSSKKPCRFKACKGVIHRGPCPIRQAIGSKGGSVKTPILSDAQINQRKQASKKPRTPSLSRNSKVTASNLKRIANRIKLNVCLFCGVNHEGLCQVASNAGATSQTIKLMKKQYKNNQARKLANAQEQARLKREAKLLNKHANRPQLNLNAIPSTYHFDCIKCNTTKTAIHFKFAFADDLGYGLCKPCNSEISKL